MSAMSAAELFGRVRIDMRVHKSAPLVDGSDGCGQLRHLVGSATLEEVRRRGVSAPDTQGVSQPNTEGAPMTLPRLLTLPCACGRPITADPDRPFQYVVRHNATPEHSAWASVQDDELELVG